MIDPAIAQAGLKAVGAPFGGFANMYGQGAKRKELNAIISGLEGLQGDVSQQTAQQLAQNQAAFAPYMQGLQGQYSDLMNTVNSIDYNSLYPSSPAQFEFDKGVTIDAYKERNNEAIQAEIDRALGGVKQTGAASGSLFSGATGKALARSAADIQGRYNQQAEQFAQQEEQNKYQQAMNRWNQDLQLAQAKMGAQQSALQNKQSLFNTTSNLFSQGQQQQSNIQTSGNQTLNDLRAQQIAAQGAKKGTTSGAGAFLQGFASSLGG